MTLLSCIAKSRTAFANASARHLFLLAVAIVWATTGANAMAAQPPGAIPAGTRLRFHLVAPISSNESKTGQTFAFVLLDPILANGNVVLANGTTGSGTVFLAGHAGSSGHEGDLTLRLDSIRTADGREVTFADQRFEINGRNRKIQSAALGFVPFVGIGARFIRGSDVRVDEKTPIETILVRPAPITAEPAAPSPAPSASARPAPSATPLPAPSATPSAAPSAAPSASPS